MRLESLPADLPEDSPSTGAKRIPATCDVERETKRLRTQHNPWHPESTPLQISSHYNSREDGSITSNPKFGVAESQNDHLLQADGVNTVPLDNFGGLGSHVHPPAAEYGVFLGDYASSQMVGIDMQSIQWPVIPDEQLDTPWSTNNLDWHHSFPESERFELSFEPSQDPNTGQAGDLLGNWMFAESSGSVPNEPLIDVASNWISLPTESENAGRYQPLHQFEPPGFESKQRTAGDEGVLLTYPDEADLMGNENTSRCSASMSHHSQDLSGLGNFSQPALSEATPKSFDMEPNQVDVCFGVIIADVASSWTGSPGTEVTPVTMSPLADVMKLSFQDSQKYVGILDIPVLCKLQAEFTIEYNAKLVAPEPRRADQRTSVEKAKKLGSDRRCSVRIVVCGVKSEKYSVSRLLSEAGLYLQHPSVTEIYSHIDYWNPHYLLRPGAQMPRLEALSISADTNIVVANAILDEAHKNRFTQILNSAHGPIGPLSATQSPRIKSKLKDHQVTALAMMIEKECGVVENARFPTLWESTNSSGSMVHYRHKITGTCQSIPTPIYGGILADDMGLGKSLSLLALVCSSLDSQVDQESSPDDGISRATLLVTPKSTIPGWQQQVKRHIHPSKLRVMVYHGPNRCQLLSKFWKTDIVLTTYETLRLDCADTGPLYSGTWRRVVLDEAHHIRNRISQSFKAACAVSSKSRWCLTGTPIHNSLDDYGALLSFLGVPILMEKSQFDFWITSPIKRKQQSSMQQSSMSRFGDLVSATCLRRTKDIVHSSLKLPSRVEKIEKIELHKADRELYEFFREKTAKIAAGLAGRNEGTASTSEGRGANILTLINFLRRICNSGEDLLPQSAMDAWRSKSASVDWQMMQNWNNTCDSCKSFMEEVDILSDDNVKFGCHHTICTTCSVRGKNTMTEETRKCPKCESMRAISEKSFSLPEFPLRISAKVEALIRNLVADQTVVQQGEEALTVKSVIFSQWTKTLDLIANALAQNGLQFQRIDGQSSLKQRTVALQQFKKDAMCTVMIASIGSAGEGQLYFSIDLTTANHVHLVEPHWSPMAEAQAVDRVHRIGQTREVVVTRYIVSNSIETYIQWVQQDKLGLITRSLDLDEISQSDIDDARWKTLRKALGVSSQ